jgi:transposase
MIGKTGSVRNLIREPAAVSSKTTIYVAIELSASSWLVAARLPGIKKVRIDRLESGDTIGLLEIIAELRSQVSKKLGIKADLACCFEAGRDGFWLHRLLTANAVEPTCSSPPASW